MKNNFTLSMCGLLLTLALAQSAYAQTPDGQTPANEGVCDVLQEDGVTKGLYGLCVAFCEAQDHADLSDPITEEELEALEDAAPSGRILANYNKKKQDGDPDMPCIKVEEPCPCWDSAEFDSVVNSSNNVDSCHRYNGPRHNGSIINHYDRFDPRNTQRYVFALDHQHHRASPPYVIGTHSECYYRDNTQSPRILRVIRTTPEDFAACDAQIRQAQIDTSRTCTDGS